jgi:hypothetical protein
MSKVTRDFTQEELEDLDIPYSINGTDRVLDENYKWSSYWHGVFEFENAMWLINWAEGANQYDEVDLWDDFPVTAVQVEKAEVTRMEWVPVNV